jgi:dipeptidyl aminopeptidase/acylaminoacyl peptidase
LYVCLQISNISKLLGKFNGKEGVEWNSIENALDIIPKSLSQKLENFSMTVYSITPKDDGHVFECILLKPDCPKDAKLPLIVFPHGGPHSVSPISFSAEEAFYLLNGYATLKGKTELVC